MKTVDKFLICVFAFAFAVNLAVTFVNSRRITSLLTTRRINNMRIAKLQKERAQMQKVIKRMAKSRGF